MARTRRRRTEHLFAETDGQVYLVRDRGRWRLPHVGSPVPFPWRETARMDFGSEVVVRAKPKLAHHPEEWFAQDDLFSRSDVDDLVKKAAYMAMARLVAEVVVVKGGRVLMEKVVRGFSRGHWNIPGGFLDYGERPEDGARREAQEELGVRVRIDRPLDVYMSGFPGKPAYTIGFVYRGTLLSERFRLKGDEIEAADWFPVWQGLGLMRNPFAKWALVDTYRQGDVPAIRVHRHRSRIQSGATGPVIFLDRDGTINHPPVRAIRTPADFVFNAGAKAAMRSLRSAGYRLAVISNQDAVAWGLITTADVRRVHERMVRELAAVGAAVENVYWCPHEEADDCACRKPRPGLLLAACKDLRVSPWEAWMVGDRPEDVLAGKAIGARTAFVGDPSGTAIAGRLREAMPDLVVPDLMAFARRMRKGTPAPQTEPANT